MRKLESWPAIVVAILSALAIFEWPYGYYQFLRLAVFAVAIYYLYAASKYQVKIPAKWLLIGFGLLFNPIAPITLERSTWAFFNLACAGYFYWVSRNTSAV